METDDIESHLNDLENTQYPEHNNHNLKKDAYGRKVSRNESNFFKLSIVRIECKLNPVYMI
jgi:hypothetical protein